MDNIISLKIENRLVALDGDDYIPPTAGNVGKDFVEITLDSEFSDYDRYRVTFDGVGEPVPIDWDGIKKPILIPWETITDQCVLRVGVAAMDFDGTIRLVTAFSKGGIHVRPNTKDGGVEPTEPTKDILAQAVEATNRANEVSERVEGAEAERVATFNANQQERDDAFNAAQTERAEKFSEDQHGRSNAFNSDMAEWAQEVSQKVAEAAMAAQAANNAANNISQRADSGEFNGAPFSISYTPTSIAALNAIQGAKQGEFAVINSSVENPDNAKLFMFGNGTWNLMSDLSGATGFGLQGKQGVSLKGVRVVNQTQVEVTQYDPMTEQERTYVIGNFAAPLAAGVKQYVDNVVYQSITRAEYDALTAYLPGVVYMVKE